MKCVRLWVAMLVLLGMFSSPVLASEDDLVGTWDVVEEDLPDGVTVQYTFEAGGGWVMSVTTGGIESSGEGTYGVDGDRLTLTFPAEFSGLTRSGGFVIEGETLTMAPDEDDPLGGRPLVLRRVQADPE